MLIVFISTERRARVCCNSRVSHRPVLCPWVPSPEAKLLSKTVSPFSTPQKCGNSFYKFCFGLQRFKDSHQTTKSPLSKRPRAWTPSTSACPHGRTPPRQSPPTTPSRPPEAPATPTREPPERRHKGTQNLHFKFLTKYRNMFAIIVNIETTEIIWF